MFMIFKTRQNYHYVLSDSEEEVVSRKPKTTKLFNSDDDESDNDKKSEKSSGFVDHSDDSQGSSKSLSSRNESDHERRYATVKNSKPDDSPAKSEKPDGSDDERRSQSKKSRSSSSSSDDEKTPRSRKSSSSSNSSNKSKPSQSRKSRSNSSSSGGSRSRKSSSSSSSSGDEKKSQSRKSRSSSNSSSDGNRSQFRKSRSSSSSSNDEKNSQSRKSRSSSNSSSDGNRSQSRKSRSSSSSSGDEKKSQSRKSRSNSNCSDDEIRPRPKKCVKKSSSSGDKKRSKSKSDSSDNETVSQSKRSNSSDSDSRSACSQNLKKNNASDNEKSAPNPKPTKADSNNSQQKSGGKYSLITASDLESEDDTRPVLNESTSDDEIRMKSNKKSKKLYKKSSSSKKSAHSKSNGLFQAFDSSGSDDEERSSPKSVQKSAAKRKSEAKPPKGSKASKKEKDPLLSIRSETQRMIREGRISLPYHQPKQRSLHEFLQRRKTAPSIPLKATPEVLRNVCERLINKEKEVEDFYKSESDNSETEAQPSNLPETKTDEVNDTPKDVESTSGDLPVDKETPVEMELDKDTNSTITDNHESENPSSVVSEQNKDTNSMLIDDSPERVDPESNKNDDPELKSDENPSTEKLAEPISTEENPTEPITVEGSNPQPTPKDDQITPMDVDKHIENPPKDFQDLVNVARLNQSATEQVIEQDMPDSEDFVLQIEDSCNDYTDNITKPSNLPAPKVLPSDETTKPTNPLASETLPDSSDFELRIEDSCNDTETTTETVPSSEAEKSSVNTAEPTSKPAIFKDRIKNRIEALLSTRNIKLSSINLNSALEPIQFEIPSFQSEPKGIHQLKEKFVKHSMAKKKPKSTSSQVNVVTTQTDTEGGVIGVSKETLTLGLNDEENEFSNPKLQAPGAKHAYLKKKMLDMLISKKEATWNEYQNEKCKYYGSDDEENDIDGDNDDDDVATCKKLNFEPYHPEDEPDDDELIEDDVVYEEKTRDKNCFLDEEAEVSDVEDEEDDNHVEQDDVDNAEDDDKNSVDSDGLDFHVEEDSPSMPDKSKDDTESNKLFKYNTTGSDLEKKLLGLESISQTNLNDDVSASQIFGLCSGTFATQHLPKSNNTGAVSAANQDDDFFIDSQNAEDSQNICLSLPDTDNTIEKSTEESNKDTFFKQNDTPGDDDEEEEEIFTRKKPTMRIVEDSDDETNEPTNEANVDASDEDNCVDDQDEDEAGGENIDEDDEEEEAEGVDDIEAEEFGYNSEEELVSYDKAAAREFFENEAELSESEWGSEDENEKDLDKLEKEEGDDDEIDADKLKEELGKIHMRQLLDDDQHDVRLLKEMLLEDGELHSDAKRQRKFQWKSLTDGDDFFKNYSYDSDDEINLNDDDNDNDESEEHWRKIRHERETFLSQQEKKSILNDTITETVESTFASTKIIDESIVTKIVQRTSFSSTANTSKDKLDQDLSKMNPKIKCGSFLSRGKLLLSKMTLSVSETKENLRGAKNSRNFVFGARSPKKEVPVTVEKTEKRKSTSTSASVPKKVRLSTDNGTNPARRKGLLARLALTE